MMQMAFPLAPEEDFELEDPPHWCKYNVGGEEMVILSAAPKMLRESRRIDLAMRDILVRCCELLLSCLHGRPFRTQNPCLEIHKEWNSINKARKGIWSREY